MGAEENALRRVDRLIEEATKSKSSVEDQPARRTEASAEAMQKWQRFCSFCGRDLTPSSRFCDKCGRRVGIIRA